MTQNEDQFQQALNAASAQVENIVSEIHRLNTILTEAHDVNIALIKNTIELYESELQEIRRAWAKMLPPVKL